jgi:hypothetical protein
MVRFRFWLEHMPRINTRTSRAAFAALLSLICHARLTAQEPGEARTDLVSLSPSESMQRSALSADGRYVVFSGAADSDRLPPDGFLDIFV